MGSSLWAHAAAGVSQELPRPARCFWWPGVLGWPSLCAGEGGHKPPGSNASALQDCAGLPLAGEAENLPHPLFQPHMWGNLGLGWAVRPKALPIPVMSTLFPQVLPQVQAAP